MAVALMSWTTSATCQAVETSCIDCFTTHTSVWIIIIINYHQYIVTMIVKFVAELCKTIVCLLSSVCLLSEAKDESVVWVQSS